MIRPLSFIAIVAYATPVAQAKCTITIFDQGVADWSIVTLLGENTRGPAIDFAGRDQNLPYRLAAEGDCEHLTILFQPERDYK